MCDQCTYTITCRVCGDTYKQMGSMDDSEPCGRCTRWFRIEVLKFLSRKGILMRLLLWDERLFSYYVAISFAEQAAKQLKMRQ